MSLPKEAIEEFKQLYKKEFGVELSDYDAYDKATRLFTLVKIVTKPIPENKKDGNTRGSKKDIRR